jgi:ribosomal protein S18 acetylase RimI-like enzyme
VSAVAGRVLSYAITGPRDEERNLLADSWRRSLQDQPASGAMPARAYVAWASGIIASFLGPDAKAIALGPHDRLYIARDTRRPAYVYGWLLARDMQPGLALVYAYVKSAERRQGIASELLLHAIEQSADGPLSYAFHTRMDPWLESLGLSYLPVQTLEFGERKAS